MQTPDEIKKGLSCGEKIDKDDAISREYCLDSICKLPLNWEYGLGVEDCYKIVENAPSIDGQVRKWISVEEMLPEHDVDVLIIAKGWNERTVYIGRLHEVKPEKSWLTGLTNNGSEWKIYGFSYLKEPIVTHWMPLPEPPKEDEPS